MSARKRVWEDIKEVHIYTDKAKNGWVFDVDYKDGKSVTMSVDYGDLKTSHKAMWILVYKCIIRQITEGKEGLI